MNARVGYFCFNRQGDQLAVRYVTSNSVEIWDLRLIRQQLLDLGLDWDLPPYPEAANQKFAPIAKVVVDAGTATRAHAGARHSIIAQSPCIAHRTLFKKSAARSYSQSGEV